MDQCWHSIFGTLGAIPCETTVADDVTWLFDSVYGIRQVCEFGRVREEFPAVR